MLIAFSRSPLKASKPPSTGTTTPVTNDAAALQSQTTVPASSSGSPKRPAGVDATMRCPRAVSPPGVVEQERAVLLADEEAGCDRVHAHAARRQLDGEPPGQVLDRRLRGAVADDARERAVRRQRRDVDDRSVARRVAVDHGGTEDLSRQHRAVEVELDHLVEGGCRQLEERLLADRRCGDVAAGGVDEHVDAPPAVEHGRARMLELRGVEHVGLEHERRVSEAQRELFEALATPCEQADPGAGAGEPPCDRAAEHARGAGDDCDAIAEAEQLGGGVAHTGESPTLDRRSCVRLSVITDEIDARLGPALDLCDELGIAAVELRTIEGVQIVDSGADSLRATRRELDRRGFRVCAIASPFLKCNRDDDPLAAERVLDRALETAAIMSAPVVRAFGYWREPDPGAALAELGVALGRSAARAHAAGVTLALENEHECNVATSAEALAALDAAASLHLRLIWDPGNAAMLDPRAFAGLGGLETICDRVAHVHLKDVTSSGSWTRVGDGIVDFSALLGYLVAAEYEGYLSFETHYQRDGSGELATRDCVAALRSSPLTRASSCRYEAALRRDRRRCDRTAPSPGDRGLDDVELVGISALDVERASECSRTTPAAPHSPITETCSRLSPTSSSSARRIRRIRRSRSSPSTEVRMCSSRSPSRWRCATPMR